jgi:LysM repeat protein
MKSKFRVLFAVAALACALSSHEAHGYTHLVAKGETLAQVSLRVYGDSRYESVLAAANGLDVPGGGAIAPGMRLVVPAPVYHRVVPGETWADLAERFLGERTRAETLAQLNGGVSWVPPSDGQTVEIPAVVAHLAGEGATMAKIAQRYAFNANKAWELDAFNNRKPGSELLRGELVLVPIAGLSLTRDGREEARKDNGETAGATFVSQRRTLGELPTLLGHVRGGRYVEGLTIHRSLLECYVALGAISQAARACTDWKANLDRGELEDKHLLDPVLVSPKIRAACTATPVY